MCAFLYVIFDKQAKGTTEKGPGGDTHTQTRIVLHVGPPKTGSTTIQYGLLDQEPSMNLDGWTILHPSQLGLTAGGLAKKGNQVSNIATCYGVKKPKKLVPNSTDTCLHWQDFLAQLRQTETAERIVMSSESFSHVNGDDLSQLASDLSPFHTTASMVYRPFCQWISSVYRQTQQNKKTGKFDISLDVWLTDEQLEHRGRGFTNN